MPLKVVCPYPHPTDPDDICATPLKVYGFRDVIENLEGDCPHVEEFYEGGLDLTILEAACDETARAWTVERD